MYSNTQYGVERLKSGGNMTYMTYTPSHRVFSRAHDVSHVSHDVFKYIGR